jgi:hypothetical protein
MWCGDYTGTCRQRSPAPLSEEDRRLACGPPPVIAGESPPAPRESRAPLSSGECPEQESPWVGAVQRGSVGRQARCGRVGQRECRRRLDDRVQQRERVQFDGTALRHVDKARAVLDAEIGVREPVADAALRRRGVPAASTPASLGALQSSVRRSGVPTRCGAAAVAAPCCRVKRKGCGGDDPPFVPTPRGRCSAPSPAAAHVHYSGSIISRPVRNARPTADRRFRAAKRGGRAR